ncbi:MAG: hypothetical protein EOM12_17995 [Verrucomicrobiae bacterium]|nr:hypothetical protein [Verrucomicrobiae bacterium]
MIRLHKIWLIVTALIGIPVAGLGLLLFIPAIHDRSWAAPLLLIPTGLVVWAFACHIRIYRDSTFTPSNIRHMAWFYIVAGLVSVWSSTWSFTREGNTGQMFSLGTTIATTCFFALPLIELAYERYRIKKNTEQDKE